MPPKKRYYVVWEGRDIGIFDDWEEARLLIDHFPGARYKAFPSKEEAEEAFRRGLMAEDSRQLGNLLINSSRRQAAAAQAAPQPTVATTAEALRRLCARFPEIDPAAWASDASCLGNPGVMEYQAVDLATGRRIFHFGPVRPATNNIGEFLALVHALALMDKRGEWHTLYTDSRTALSWMRHRHAKTTISPSALDPRVADMLRRAEEWLRTHEVKCRVMKWQTELWGEIPADFGRK